MTTIMLSQIKTGDTVITKKCHPCGGNKWTVLSTGAEFKLQCATCSHTVILSGETLRKSVKTLIKATEEA